MDSKHANARNLKEAQCKDLIKCRAIHLHKWSQMFLTKHYNNKNCI